MLVYDYLCTILRISSNFNCLCYFISMNDIIIFVGGDLLANSSSNLFEDHLVRSVTRNMIYKGSVCPAPHV